MSQPRRRRRRRRRGTTSEGEVQPPRSQSETQATGQPGLQPTASEQPLRAGRGRRRRRGRGRQRAADAPSPRSSADIFRAERAQPVVVGAPHDGRTLEAVIGELQSIWGVPQSPQEYRITLKVAEEREVRGERVAAIEEVKEEPPGDAGAGQPRREKAPAAPRISGGPLTDATSDEGEVPTRRKRSRRRRRRGRRPPSGA